MIEQQHVITLNDLLYKLNEKTKDLEYITLYQYREWEIETKQIIADFIMDLVENLITDDEKTTLKKILKKQTEDD